MIAPADRPKCRKGKRRLDVYGQSANIDCLECRRKQRREAGFEWNRYSIWSPTAAQLPRMSAPA
jgi:hypothetical protein